MKGQSTTLQIILIILLLAWLMATIALKEKCETLKKENEILKEENQMLKNTLEDFGAQIEDMSNQIDRLLREGNRGKEWNEGVDR